jgi:hypothetical protein
VVELAFYSVISSLKYALLEPDPTRSNIFRVCDLDFLPESINWLWLKELAVDDAVFRFPVGKGDGLCILDGLKNKFRTRKGSITLAFWMCSLDVRFLVECVFNVIF